MRRLRPRLLLLLAALLLVIRVVVPVSSSPPPQTSLAATVPDIPVVTATPELNEINREVDRLRERLAEPVRAVAPVRDPFQFAFDRPFVEPRPSLTRRDDDLRAADAALPPIVWPTLVAILSTGSDASPSRRVGLEDAAGLVHLRSIGDAHGDVTVSAIAADAVTLVHTASGASTRLVLD